MEGEQFTLNCSVIFSSNTIVELYWKYPKGLIEVSLLAYKYTPLHQFLPWMS